MNITSDSFQCTSVRPQCLSEAPGKYFPPRTKFNLSQPWCNEGALYQSWEYRYQWCKLDHIDQYIINRKLVCHCLNHLFQDCVPFSDNENCTMIFGSILSLQFLTTSIGIILNTIIVTIFCKRRPVRRKIPNILLANQAIADLFNAGVFGLQRQTVSLILMTEKERSSAAIIISNAATTITLSSSIFLYTIIAIERYLSIYFPLWSRVHVMKKHIWASIIVSWLMSFVFGGLLALRSLLEGEFHRLGILYVLIYILMVSLAVLVTILFISTFTKAFLSLRSHLKIQFDSINSASKGRIDACKKQLHLTTVFLLMFIVFASVNVPLSVVLSPGSTSSYALYEIILSLLILTSLLNPILTLSFQKQFRVLQPRTQTNSSMMSNPIEMQQVEAMN